MKNILAAAFFLIFTGCSGKTDVRETISCPDAPAAIGPYSQAVRVRDTLYISGQLGLNPATGKLAGPDFESQARQSLRNHRAILEHAGFTMKDVVQCQVFLTEMDNYPAFNKIYSEYFTEDFPARAVFEVSRIPADGLIEIMITADRSR